MSDRCPRCNRHYFYGDTCPRCALQDAVDSEEIARHRARIENETVGKIAVGVRAMRGTTFEREHNEAIASWIAAGCWRKP